MADYKVTDTELTSIANAIRTKGGTQAQLEFPTGFVSAVQAIPTGGSGVVQPLSVTQNGTYNPPSGVDGYAPVTVNVSGGGGSTNILHGTSVPVSGQGNNGDIYLYHAGNRCIQADGNCMVLTGLTVNDFDEVKMILVPTEYASGKYYSVFGASTSSSSGATNGKTLRLRDGSANHGAIGYSGSWTYTPNGTFQENQTYNIDAIIKVGEQMLIVNGNVLVYTSSTSSTSTNTVNVALLNNSLNGAQSTSGFKGNIAVCDFYNNGTLVRHFVPAVDSQNVACFYDSVTDEYYYNTGTGTMTYESFSDQMIMATYLKVNGAWQELIGSDITDVNLGS